MIVTDETNIGKVVAEVAVVENAMSFTFPQMKNHLNIDMVTKIMMTTET